MRAEAAQSKIVIIFKITIGDDITRPKGTKNFLAHSSNIKSYYHEQQVLLLFLVLAQFSLHALNYQNVA